MSAPITWWEADDALGRVYSNGTDSLGRHYIVQRHGAGRSHWDAVLPDGSTETFTRKSDATAACEAWEELLPGEVSGESNPSDRDETASPDLPAALAALANEFSTYDPRGADRSSMYGYNSAGEKQLAALHAIRGLAIIRAEIETLIQSAVDAARVNSGNSWSSNAATWDQVGGALGVKKQSASARYGVKKD